MCFTNRCIISVLIVEQNMCGFTCQKLYLKGWISIFPLQIFKTKTVSSSETCLNGPITSLIVERWRYFLIGFWKYQGKYFCPQLNKFHSNTRSGDTWKLYSILKTVLCIDQTNQQKFSLSLEMLNLDIFLKFHKNTKCVACKFVVCNHIYKQFYQMNPPYSKRQ